MTWTKEQKYTRAILLLAKNHNEESRKIVDKVATLEHELNKEFAENPSLVNAVREGTAPKKLTDKLIKYYEGYKQSREIGRKLGEDLRRNGRLETALKKVEEQAEAESAAGLPYSDTTDIEHQREIDRLQAEHDEHPTMESYSKMAGYKLHKGDHPDVHARRQRVNDQLRKKWDMAALKEMTMKEAVKEEKARRERQNQPVVDRYKTVREDIRIPKKVISSSPNKSSREFDKKVQAELDKEL